VARLRSPVIEGRSTSAAAAAVAVSDIAHGVGALIAEWPPPVGFVNPDLTVLLTRDPVPGWLRLGIDECWPGDATGVAVTHLADQRGLVGVSVQTQVLTEMS
jgi:hypothetical protein